MCRLCFEPFYVLWCSVCVFLTFVHRFYLYGQVEQVFRNMDPIILIVLWFAYEQMQGSHLSTKSLTLFEVKTAFLFFVANLGELKGKTGKRRCVDCWHSNYFRVLKACQDINVFSEIQHDQTQKARLCWKASIPFLRTGRCFDGRTRSKAAPELSFEQADTLC